jgi:hypothetical protein
VADGSNPPLVTSFEALLRENLGGAFDRKQILSEGLNFSFDSTPLTHF